MKKLFTVLLAFAISQAAFSQQEVWYSMFFSNKVLLNPAYTGSRDALNITGFYRNQWTGFDGAPVSQSLTVHTPFLKQKMGLGLSLEHDKIGINNSMSLQLSYAYRLQLGFGRLAMGVHGKIERDNMNWSNSNPYTSIDQSIPYSDNSLFLPNLGAGLYFDNDFMYLGISTPHLVENTIDYSNSGGEVSSGAKQNRHYYLMAGGLIALSEILLLKPALMARYVDNSPVELDFNLSFLIREMLWLGVSARTGNTYSAIAQVHLKNEWVVGYAYDFTFTKLNNFQNGTHEIMFSIDFGKKIKGFDNPRYF